MSNLHGLDFLRSEHTLQQEAPSSSSSSFLPPANNSSNQDGTNESSPITMPHPADVRNKPDLEKQYDILAFLQKHRGSGSTLAPSLIYRATGIDLEGPLDAHISELLQNNPKIKTELVPDPENPTLYIAHYAYKAKYPQVRNKTTLLAQVNRMQEGVPSRDLMDCYQGIQEDISNLIRAGEIIAVVNTEDKDKILFPRGESFFVELDGLLSVPDPPPGLEQSNSSVAKEQFGVFTDVDPTRQLRRGEAICVGGCWFRVSSAVRAGVPLAEQPARAQAPHSVSSLRDLSDRNQVDGYIRPFTSKHVPLDHALPVEARQNIQDARVARERVLKIGRSGGVTSQLTASYAHSSNPTTLAASFAQSHTHHHHRSKRPKTVTAAEVAALQEAASDPALALYSHARRHGCTKDVREMYLSTRKDVPESDAGLKKVLVKHKLLEEGEQLRRPRLAVRSNVDGDGKPKKRRYYERKNQRMTNTHLQSTEIGAILARAAEKQKQGKSVGDGGM